MNYEKIYDDLCFKGISRGYGKGYGFEFHHIIPRCLGGKDSKDNLAKLTAREHYIAHKLLTKIHKASSKDIYSKMCAALWFMSQTTTERGVVCKNSKQYDNNRKLFFKESVIKIRELNSVKSNIFKITQKDHNKNKIGLFSRFFNLLNRDGDGLKILTHKKISYNKRYKGKNIRKLEAFFRFCYTIYKMGYEGVSLEYHEKALYLKYFPTMFYEIKEGTKVYQIFSEECLEVFNSMSKNTCTRTLWKTLNYCSFKGSTIFLNNWNKKNPDKLIFNVVVGNLCYFIPINSWDYSSCDFIYKPLTREDLSEKLSL